jgi:AhpD family alkylhydroperoxidase
MQQRFDYTISAPGVYDSMDVLDCYLQGCGLERELLFMVQLRVSQMNGCAYCIDMHWQDLRSTGEVESRLYSLEAWRQCSCYSDRERAALWWAEAVTFLADGHVPDDVHERARAQFDEKELADLTLAVATVNAWNRLSIAARLRAGGYRAAGPVAQSAGRS